MKNRKKINVWGGELALFLKWDQNFWGSIPILRDNNK